MSLTKLSLGGNIPAQGEFSQWHPGWGRENRLNFFTVQVLILWGGGKGQFQNTEIKLFDIPVPSRDVTYQTLPGRE
jgi:hypothetical protein